MNKRIEEMAKTLCGQKEHSCAECDSCDLCEFWLEASILYANGYHKSTDVVAEVLEILSELKENYLADDDVREACAISYAEIKIVALKKKYESEGADDE